MGIRHTKEMTYKMYNKASKEAHEIAAHLGADPKEIQKALDKKQAKLPKIRQ